MKASDMGEHLCGVGFTPGPRDGVSLADPDGVYFYFPTAPFVHGHKPSDIQLGVMGEPAVYERRVGRFYRVREVSQIPPHPADGPVAEMIAERGFMSLILEKTQ
jgi:hypothetical protein